MRHLKKSITATLKRLSLNAEALGNATSVVNRFERGALLRVADRLRAGIESVKQIGDPCILVDYAQMYFNRYIAAVVVAKAHALDVDRITVTIKNKNDREESYNVEDYAFDADEVSYIIADCAFNGFEYGLIRAGDKVLFRFDRSDPDWETDALKKGIDNVPLLEEGKRQLRAELYRLDRLYKIKEREDI